MDESFCWDILDTYFQKGGSQEAVNPLIKHQIDSYNKFIDNTLTQIITGFNPIKIGHVYKHEVNDHIHKIFINVLQPSLTKPSYQLQDGTQTIMTPHIARMNNLTYSSNLYVNVHLVIEVINQDGVIEKFDKTINNVYIGKIPVMVRSKACILYQMPGLGEENNNECRYDFGGYFIINGNEKVLISQDRINENKTLVFQPNNNIDGLYAEIRSMSDSTYLPPKTTSLNMSGKLNHMGRIIRMNTSFLRSEIPVFVMFRALGIISDNEIIQHIVHDLDNNDNKRIITELMACCEDACDVHTQEQAENMLIKIMTGSNKTTNAIELLRNNITNDFLPHVGKNYRRKALYLGFMIRKMIRIYLGYDTYDNRDSYMNKRIDTPGILMSNLFRQCYGKMTKEMKNLIERELNLWRANQSVPTSEIITDINIHRYFKQSLLDSWLKYSLSTGNWGIKSIGSFQNIRQGVSQVLNRMSYASTLSHLRRINTAMEKNGKLVQPRKLDNSQMGMICPAECFYPNTPILMWNGTIKKAEDIIVGDYLIDDKGNAVRVKSTCSGEKMMYEVVQHKNNFMNYTVTDNHILTLKVKLHKNVRNKRGKLELMWFDKKELKYKYKYFNNTEDLNEFSSSIDDDNVIDITIEQYLSLPENVQKQLYTFKSNGINWETKEVALDPYILGMWLGDGLSHGYGFITADKELLDEWIKWGVDNDATITKNKHKYRYTFSSTINNTQSGISCNKTEKAPLKKLLAKYNLVNNKHIPLDYLTNDRKTRLAVLAGLIDTDGSVRANGHDIRISQGEPNYKIIYDAEFLARSLGFSCHLNDGTCSYTVNGEKRQKPYKELYITGKNLYEIPTILPRKKLNKLNDIIREKRSDGFLQSSFELVQKNIQPFVGWQLDGNGRFLLGDMSTSHNTPEGASVGLVKNMALSTHISVSMNSAYIRNLLIEFDVKIYDDSYSYKLEDEEKWFNETDNLKGKRKNITEYLKQLGNYDNVYVQINGDILGYHTNPNELYEKLKHYKRCGIIHPMTSIVWNIKHRFICISTEAGRMYRPLLIVDLNEETGKREIRLEKILREKNLTWDEFKVNKSFDTFVVPCAGNNFDLEEEGFIEYMDSDEINHAMIAMSMVELKKGMKGTAMPPQYTHCEIHPSLMNGILGVNIPFSDHNQSPRNCYQAAMGKQALGVYMSNFNKRIDTMGNILNYPQKPLVFTKLSKYTYSSELPSGTNAIVAIMTHTGFNQEDSVMINQSALDRGLFTSTYYKAFRDQCTKNHSTGEEEVFTNPTGSTSLKPFSYDKLDDSGFVPLNSFVDGNDILVGKVMPKKANGVIAYQDNSMCMKANDEGYIDMNYTGINSEGYKFCKVRVRKNRKPEIGDKLASRSAQKGTIGMAYKHQDMPFTKSGIVPDIIMNPHAIPSRMTMAQLMECIMGKASCHIGATGDSTPYTDCTVESIAKVLELSGMERYGNEIMYNGRTGEQIQTEIFIGPTYYQRLKHMVQDKLHCLKSDHEVLTTEGWKFIPEITKEDKVATLKDGKLVYENPLEIHHYPNYKGKMYRIKNQAIDLDVTANHRMYISSCHTRQKEWSEYRLEKAEDIIGKMIKYKKNAEWDAPDYQFILPAFDKYEEKVVDMKSWITFFGIWIAEGWAYNGKYKNKYRIGFAVNKQRVKDVLYDAVNKLGYSYNVCDEHLEINDKQFHAYLAPLSVGAPNKRLPEWVWSLSKEQAQHLVYSMQLGDGCFDKKTTGSMYYTSSVGLSDDFMRLLLHAGWSGMKTIHIKAGDNKSKIRGKDIVNNYDIWRISVIKSKNEPCVNHGHHKKQNIQEEELYDYEGAVYCLSVSSEIFMIRRNGKPVWTGNSRGSNGPIVMLTRQPSEGRARNGGLRLGEMERDCFIGHGTSAFLKERMLDSSDNYRVFVCKNCGMIANVNPDKNIYKCSACKTGVDIVQARIPYAFKLLGQELYTMNILMRYVCN